MICFILGMPAWMHTQGPDRRWQVLYSWCRACSRVGLMWMLSLRDRQCIWEEVYSLARLLFEHKWATLNSNSHMAADVTAVTIVSALEKSFQIQYIMQKWLSYHNSVPEKQNMAVCLLMIHKVTFTACMLPASHLKCWHFQTYCTSFRLTFRCVLLIAKR